MTDEQNKPLFESFFQGGFECSTHRRGDGVRLDMIAATGHDRLALNDYLRLRDQGIRTARDGLRWHLIESTPGVYDFSSVLPMLRAARTAELQVIWDLCHYGWPDWLNIFSPKFVARFAGFARAFTEVLLREGEETPFIVLINEISFFSWAGGEVGFFNPCSNGRGHELKAQLVRAAIAASEAIWAVAPEARICQIDPLINVVAADPSDENQRQAAEAYRLAQYEAWDMLAGRLHPELGGAEKYLDVMGVNFYSTNQWLHADGKKISRGHPQYRPFREMVTEAYERYRRPIFVAETGIEDEARPEWLSYIGGEVRAAMRAGVPVEGICLYPIVNHPGWSNERHCHNGLWDYPDEDGGRDIYQPLALEIKRQRKLFAGLLSDAPIESSDEGRENKGINEWAPSDPGLIPRPEYPRPQFVREQWLNLNGIWEFAFDDADIGYSDRWHEGEKLDGSILVPFPYQCELSEINDRSIHEIVWYGRSFEVPPDWLGRDLLLHFGAVDYATTVWVNGQEVGHNRGGHVPFLFDIAPYLKAGSNRLILRVEDRQNPRQPRGKQSSTGLPHDIDYYCTTGIWQTVWLEPVPPIRIEEILITPNAEKNVVEAIVYLHAPASKWRVEAELSYAGRVITRSEDQIAISTARLRLQVPYAKLWSPATTHLYDLHVRLFDGDQLLDEIRSYVGIRSIRMQDGQILLNGQPTYLKLALDQGYWPQSYLAAPSDEALQTDIGWAKQFGFNGVRKHQKIEDPRWLYWCDRLGLLVWEEMPNAREWSLQTEEYLVAEWARAVRRDYNHPCIIAWVPVNESMGFPKLGEQHPGQYAFIERMVADTRRLDATRPVIDNDGWEHTDITDICAIHDYTPTGAEIRARYEVTNTTGALPPRVWIGGKPLFTRGSRYRGQPIVLSEVGGFLNIPPDLPVAERDLLYQFYASVETAEELLAKYRDLMEGIAALKFLAGFCYTQLTDIEQEINGLMTYDRRPKVPPEWIADIHRDIFR